MTDSTMEEAIADYCRAVGVDTVPVEVTAGTGHWYVDWSRIDRLDRDLAAYMIREPDVARETFFDVLNDLGSLPETWTEPADVRVRDLPLFDVRTIEAQHIDSMIEFGGTVVDFRTVGSDQSVSAVACSNCEATGYTDDESSSIDSTTCSACGREGTISVAATTQIDQLLFVNAQQVSPMRSDEPAVVAAAIRENRIDPSYEGAVVITGIVREAATPLSRVATIEAVFIDVVDLELKPEGCEESHPSSCGCEDRETLPPQVRERLEQAGHL